MLNFMAFQITIVSCPAPQLSGNLENNCCIPSTSGTKEMENTPFASNCHWLICLVASWKTCSKGLSYLT